jgi:hypothetical protein
MILMCLVTFAIFIEEDSESIKSGEGDGKVSSSNIVFDANSTL